MVALLKEMHFTVVPLVDPTAAQVQRELKRVADQDHTARLPAAHSR